MWRPFFFGVIPTYGVLPYAMIMILSYKPRISLRILPPINVANARYHSLLGNNNFSSGFNSFEQRAISQWSHRIGSCTVHSTSECMTLWMTSSNLTSGRRSFGGDSPLLCRLTTPIQYNLVRPYKRSFRSVTITYKKFIYLYCRRHREYRTGAQCSTSTTT